LLAKGLTNIEIATQLEITVTTAKDPMQKIMAKVKTTTRSGIVSKTLSISDHEMLKQNYEGEKDTSGNDLYPLAVS